MRPEIKQPSLPIPDGDDPLNWAKKTRLNYEWLEQVGPQLGLNISQLFLGRVLNSIITDDINSFGMYFMADKANLAKDSILERMDWEISIRETPEPIKTKLQEVIDLIQPLDLTDKTNYHLANESWAEVKDWVEQQVKIKKNWQDALDYDSNVDKIWGPYWSEFLYGRSE